MKKIKCVIVDDEPLGIEVIEAHLQKIDGIEIVAKCGNAMDALEAIRLHAADLLFLDIQMPKMTGVEFLKTIKNPPKVIFTTAYREYALESYELDAVDYLLKPISFDRFLKAVSKVYNGMPETLHIANALHDTHEPQYIYLKADKKMVKVILNEILYVESLKDYVRVKTNEKEVITHQKISYLEEKLPEDCFLRIHRSFMVAIKKIESFSATTIEVPGKALPIGRNYKDQVLTILNNGHQL